MTLPTIHPKTPILLKPEPLTPAAFEPFGTLITPPLPHSLTSYPSPIPTPLHPNHQPQPVLANQSTALKTSPVSPLTNNYPVTVTAGSTTGHDQNQNGNRSTTTQPSTGKGLMGIFSSFPRRNVYLSGRGDDSLTPKLKLGILERHPYTTQTFCPFNYSVPVQRNQTQKSSTLTSTSTSKPDDTTQSKSNCYILIIVAPTQPDQTVTPQDPPDLSRLRAFIHPLNSNTNTTDNDNDTTVPTSNVAVTYNPGTWHAPMIVLGDHRVDFLVTQFANGVPNDDCQEVLMGSGPDGNVLTGSVRWERRGRRGEGEVEVDLGGVDVDVDGIEEGWDDDRLEGKWTTDEPVLRAVRASKL